MKNDKMILMILMIYFGQKLRIWGFVIILLMVFSSPVISQSRVFKAGASSSNITPPLGSVIVGGWGTPVADYIHDQLYARSLVLNDGNETLVFVIVDNVGVNREVFEAAKAIVHNKLGIETSNMLMAATHTHSATSAGKQGEKRRGWHYGEPLDPYQSFLAQRIADGVQTALGNLEPAKIAWGSIDVPEHVFNRRWYMSEPVWSPLGEKDQVRMNPGAGNPHLVKPAGPTDPEVSFIAVESLEGKPIALLGNYSLHAVGMVPIGSVSADHWGVFADRIQELLDADRQDPPFVGIMSNGTSGDLNSSSLPRPSGKKYPPYGKMRYVGNDVAEKVFSIYKDLDFQEWVSLGAAHSELTLKVRRASPELLANMEKVRNRPIDEKPLFHPHEKIYAERIQQMEEEWPAQIDIVLQTFRIGDLGIAAIPFEVFAETGLEIKKKCPFQKTFTIELANGSYGYLPTPEQHELGGYETWLTTNKVEIEASREIVEKLLNLFATLE